MDLITTSEQLAAVCARLANHPVITVDTEFLRETTYYPLLCVVQMASADEAVVIDTLAPGHRPQAVLRADGRREGAEGVPRRPPGHRNRLAPRRHPAAPDLRHPGRRHGARLWRFHRLRPAGRAHHRPPPRQDPPLHRLVAPAADRGADALRGLRRHPFARRVRRARRRPEEARPQRLGQRGNGSPDLAEDLRLPPRARLGAAEDAGAQAEGTGGADGSRGLARTGGAEPRRAAQPRAEGRRGRRHRHPRADHRWSGWPICARCRRVSTARNGAPTSSPPCSAASPAIPRRCRRSKSRAAIPTAPRSSNC